MEKNAEEAPYVHQEAEKTLFVHEGKEKSPPANNDEVDAGEKTKKRKKRGKKSGKKANDNKAAIESAGTGMTDASASDAAATEVSPGKTESNEDTSPPEVITFSAIPEDMPAPASAAKSKSAEVVSESDTDISSPTPVMEED
jgi:hypothetical protein